MAQSSTNPTAASEIDAKPATTETADANDAPVTEAESIATAGKKPRAIGTRSRNIGGPKPTTKEQTDHANSGDKANGTSREPQASKNRTQPVTSADATSPAAARAARKGTARQGDGVSNNAGNGKRRGTGATKKPKAVETKSSIVLKKLKAAKGVTVEAIVEATGWQAHSVRGFFSAVVRKKLGLNLMSETGKDGIRRYRIVETGECA